MRAGKGLVSSGSDAAQLAIVGERDRNRNWQTDARVADRAELLVRIQPETEQLPFVRQRDRVSPSAADLANGCAHQFHDLFRLRDVCHRVVAELPVAAVAPRKYAAVSRSAN